jgi:hypothetical protein
MRRVLFVLLFSGAAGLFGQSSPSAAFSPIPILPQGGNIPSDSTQYVFLGPTVDKVTISFPSGLALGDRSGPPRTYQVDLPSQVALSATATVTRMTDGSYDYAYAAQNGSGARKGVGVWSIGTPSSDAVSSTKHETWVATVENPEGRPPGVWATVATHFVTWRNPTGAAMGPGSTTSGFHVSSSFSPGFTIVYARSADSLALPPNLPAEVMNQLAVLQRPEWLNQSGLTIGPLYPKGWSKQFIAADYLLGINRLVRHGQLNAGSPFVAGALSSLDTFVMTQGAASTVALDFLGQASGPLETSIAGAMRLSLQ